MAPLYAGTPAFKAKCHDRLSLLNKIDSAELTIQFYKRVLIRRRLMKTESGNMAALGSEGEITTMNTTENFKDVGGDEKYTAIAGDSSNTQQGQHGILSISDFFSRPVEIYNSQLALSTDIDITLNPWNMYSLIPSVRAKLRNFAYVRGDLHVRFSVSGTPFHYGRALISYQPLYTTNDTLTMLRAGAVLTANARPLLLNYLSQAPGSQIMDIKDNTPIEVVCPFIAYKPMHRVFNTSATVLAATDYILDFYESGELLFYSINQIKAVTASPSVIFLQVYAWMENVELGPATATQIAITTESGNASELDTGPIQTMASSGLSIANMLHHVPVIGPFAKASTFVLSAIKGVASIFGWSRPPILTPPIFVKNRPFANSAQTIGSETVEKISLDPRQELTIDPRCLGTDTDDMALANIWSRKSLLTSFAWGDDSPVLSTPLFLQLINPTLCTTRNYNSYQRIQPSALAFSAAPFLYWRGKIIFTFEVVCSAFHRGKYAIVYEPNQNQASLITASTSLNKQYILVVDIQETQTVSVCVDWATYRSWLLVWNAGNAADISNNSITEANSEGYFNGLIYVVPFTKLQSPDNSDVSVNVYVHGEDMQYNVPSVENLPAARRLWTQSGKMDINCKTVVPITCMPLNDSSASNAHIAEEHFGEQPVSFRQLLKRYQTVLLTSVTSVVGNSLIELTHDVIPGINSAYGTVPVLYQDFFSYLRYAYLGLKGGLRWRYHASAANSAGPLNMVRAGFIQPTVSAGLATSTASNVASAQRLQGSVMFVPMTNGGIEVEYPFYSNNLFAISCNTSLDYTGDNGWYVSEWLRRATVSFETSGTTTQSMSFALDVAAAEDFTMMRFQGAPMYTYA